LFGSFLCVCSFVLVLLFFFFFQAEDGIRDFHVTGVQTCALPILMAIFVLAFFYQSLSYAAHVKKSSLIWVVLFLLLALFTKETEIGRRRVGKECRSRWSP